MCREPGEERLGSRIAKPVFGERRCGRETNQSEARQQQGMPRKQVNRTQDFRRQYLPMFREVTHEPAPLLTVFAEYSFGVAEVALQGHGRSVVERMRQGRRRVDPLQSVFVQGQ